MKRIFEVEKVRETRVHLSEKRMEQNLHDIPLNRIFESIGKIRDEKLSETGMYPIPSRKLFCDGNGEWKNYEELRKAKKCERWSKWERKQRIVFGMKCVNHAAEEDFFPMAVNQCFHSMNRTFFYSTGNIGCV